MMQMQMQIPRFWIIYADSNRKGSYYLGIALSKEFALSKDLHYLR
jgi:hypothetical protein